MQHDCLKWRIAEDAKETGVQVCTEVYGLFAACVPQVCRQLLDALPTRKRQALVPDMLMHIQWLGQGPRQDLLFELKTLHYTSTLRPKLGAVGVSPGGLRSYLGSMPIRLAVLIGSFAALGQSR